MASTIASMIIRNNIAQSSKKPQVLVSIRYELKRTQKNHQFNLSDWKFSLPGARTGAIALGMRIPDV